MATSATALRAILACAILGECSTKSQGIADLPTGADSNVGSSDFHGPVNSAMESAKKPGKSDLALSPVGRARRRIEGSIRPFRVAREDDGQPAVGPFVADRFADLVAKRIPSGDGLRPHVRGNNEIEFDLP
jgi:hypothetical protein